MTTITTNDITNEPDDGRVTGRQVLLDAVTFAKDAGSYLLELGKRLYVYVKNAIDGARAEKAENSASD